MPRSTRRSGNAATPQCRSGALEEARAAAEEAAPAVAEGFLTKIVAGIDALVGLASGLILGALIMYYLLKDGTASPTLPRREGRLLDPGRGRRLHQRRLPDPPRLRARPHRHVRRRRGGHRRRQPPAGPSARVHHHGRELHRRLHPLHRRLPRRRAGGDRRLGRWRARRGRRHARGRARLEPDAGELRRAQGDGPHARHPPATRARRHGAGRSPRRHRRPHLGGAVHRYRRQRRRPPSVERLLQAGGRPGRADRESMLE